MAKKKEQNSVTISKENFLATHLPKPKKSQYQITIYVVDNKVEGVLHPGLILSSSVCKYLKEAIKELDK